MSAKPASNTKSGRVLAFDISNEIVSPHWSLCIERHSTCTFVSSSKRLKIVRLLGSDSLPAGNLVRPEIVAVSARGRVTSSTGTSVPAPPPCRLLLPPQPANVVVIIISARDNAVIL